MRPTLRAVIVLAILPAAAHAQPEKYGPSEQGEERHQPPAPPRAFIPTSPAFRSVTAAATLVQVNVNGQGQNIVGDAANEPSIAIDPTAPNRIVIGWRQFDSIQSSFRQAGYAYSNDGGRSWTFPGVLTPGVFRSDPVMESDSSGNFYYYTLPAEIGWICELFKSTDGGKTWSEPILANGGDRAWMTIDKSGGVGDGHIYGIWNPGVGCCGLKSFGRDTSGGTLPWPEPYLMPLRPTGGTLAVGPDGEVYGYGRNHALIRSDNAKFAGQAPTFPLAKTVGLGGSWPGFPGNPGGASGQAWVDVNRSTGPRRGHVFLFGMAVLSGNDPVDVSIVRSTDNGQNWSGPVRVNDDPPGSNNWQWFPSMSIAPGGERIDATYNATFESGNVNISRTYYTFSNDDGATWAPAIPLTPQWNSTIGWPNQDKIGDYYDQESDDVGAFVAIAATMNGGQDVYFVRIGDWDCNRNGIGDQIDLADGTLSDCDGNGIPDECEIDAGAKQDANGNGIPDVCECYADCDGSGSLDIDDFICFQTLYAVNDLAADCDGSGELDVDDFICFQTAYGVGCP